MELLPFPVQGLRGHALALVRRSDRRAPRTAPDRYHPSYPKEGKESALGNSQQASLCFGTAQVIAGTKITQEP